MIKAFGTTPCYFDGRDAGISDTTQYLAVFYSHEQVVCE